MTDSNKPTAPNPGHITPCAKPGVVQFERCAAAAVNAFGASAELIRGPHQGPWRTIEDVELATLGWVHWFNTDRIHSYLDDASPDQHEAAYAATNTDQPLVGIQ